MCLVAWSGVQFLKSISSAPGLCAATFISLFLFMIWPTGRRQRLASWGNGGWSATGLPQENARAAQVLWGGRRFVTSLCSSSLFTLRSARHGRVCRGFTMDYDYIYDPMHRREGGQYDISSRTRRRRLLTPLLLVLIEPRKLNASHVGSYSIST